jgi:hypothetical protein
VAGGGGKVKWVSFRLSAFTSMDHWTNGVHRVSFLSEKGLTGVSVGHIYGLNSALFTSE